MFAPELESHCYPDCSSGGAACAPFPGTTCVAWGTESYCLEPFTAVALETNTMRRPGSAAPLLAMLSAISQAATPESPSLDLQAALLALGDMQDPSHLLPAAEATDECAARGFGQSLACVGRFSNGEAFFQPINGEQRGGMGLGFSSKEGWL